MPGVVFIKNFGSAVYAELLAPAGTVMDLNIGAALWLAAGANGRVRLYAPTASASNPGVAYP